MSSKVDHQNNKRCRPHQLASLSVHHCVLFFFFAGADSIARHSEISPSGSPLMEAGGSGTSSARPKVERGSITRQKSSIHNYFGVCERHNDSLHLFRAREAVFVRQRQAAESSHTRPGRRSGFDLRAFFCLRPPRVRASPPRGRQTFVYGILSSECRAHFPLIKYVSFWRNPRRFLQYQIIQWSTAVSASGPSLRSSGFSHFVIDDSGK